MNKVILITGASRGIGEATARLFAGHGWSVVLAARSKEDIMRIASEINDSGGHALAVPTDITDWEAVDAMVERAVSYFGRLDAVVNNAGRGTLGAVASVEMEKVEELFRLNVLAPVAVMKAAVPHLRTNPDGGSIVNISSQAENLALPLIGVYSASKISLSYLSDAARAELSHAGVSVTNVLPSATSTDFVQKMSRVGTTDDFIAEEYLDSDVESVPASVVAWTVWRAVHEKPRQIAVSRRDGAVGRVVRAFPGVTNRLLTLGLNRYIPRTDYGAVSPKSDAKKAGAALAAVTALALVVGKSSKDSRSNDS